jgi:hypothetical protein
MKKRLAFVISILLFCSTFLFAADEETFEIEIKNISPHTKIFMIYDSSKDGVDEIGIEGPQQTFSLKPSASTFLQLKAGKYSIIEKVPAIKLYNSYEINVPEDFPKEKVIDFQRKKDIIL